MENLIYDPPFHVQVLCLPPKSKTILLGLTEIGCNTLEGL